MKCPYCMEEINDGSIVCRFCKRDFSLMAPIIQRLTSLESQVAALIALLNSLQAETDPVVNDATPPTHAASNRPLPWFAIAVLLSSFLMAMLTAFILSDRLTISNTDISIALVFTQFVLSLVIGYRYPLDTKVIFIAAVLQPLLAVAIFGAYQFLHLRGSIAETTFRDMASDMWNVAKIALIWSALLFSAGTWLGKWARKVAGGKHLASRASIRFSEKILIQATAESNDAFKKRVEGFSSVMSGVAPILTCLSSMVGSYFGYLGAVMKLHSSG